MRGEPLLGNLVTCRDEAPPDLDPRPASLVPHQVRNVLHNQVLRPVSIQDRKDVDDQISVLRAVQTELVTSLREGLAWKARAKDVMRRNFGRIDRPDIASGSDPVVLLV